MKIGEIIKSYRTKKCYSQEALANRAGIDSKYYGKVERNESSPTITTLTKICKALEISLLELFLYGSERRFSPLAKHKMINIINSSLYNEVTVHFNKENLVDGFEKIIWHSGYIGSMFFEEFELNLYVKGNIKARFYQNYELILDLNDSDVFNELSKYIKSDKEISLLTRHSDYDESILKKNSGSALFVIESNWLEMIIRNNETNEILDEISLDADSIFEVFQNSQAFLDYIFK